MDFYVYMLLCSDGSIYVGQTDNLDERLAAHEQRKYSGYTAKRLPVKLIFSERFPARDDAFSAERRIKGWTRAKKLALADGDWEMVSRLALRRTSQPECRRDAAAHGFENLTMSGKERWLHRQPLA